MGPRSKELFEEAKRYIVGGVNSPVRAFQAVHLEPFFVERALGSWIYDVDGNAYIDYVGSWGPLILGHAHPQVVKAVQEAAERGTSYGAPTASETELAKLIVGALPSIELIRFVSSGTEATMSAIRLARGYTGRGRIVKFEGCYHGHADSLLVKAGSGAMTFGIPDSSGVPPDLAGQTITLPYNSIDAVAEVFKAVGSEIACVIVEPVAGNMGVVLPQLGFLEGLREITSRYGALLIFDEVITGFRVSYSGAQGLYGIRPDLTCLGKIIGGGLPVGAYGGRREVMEQVAPLGPVYQAGTLSGNPLAMRAGIETLKLLKSPGFYGVLEEKARTLEEGFKERAWKAKVPVQINRSGSMFTVFFTETEVVDYATAKTSDTKAYARFFAEMLKRGIFLPPSPFEACFLSAAHSSEDIQKTLSAVEETFQSLNRA